MQSQGISSGGTITANFKQSIPTITFYIDSKPSFNDPNWKNYIIIKAYSNTPLPTSLNCIITCTSYTSGGQALPSSEYEKILTGLIKKGETYGEREIGGCGYSPELSISTISINSPSGWEAKW